MVDFAAAPSFYRDTLILRLVRKREESACTTRLNYSPCNTRPEIPPSYHIPTRNKSGHSHVDQVLAVYYSDMAIY